MGRKQFLLLVEAVASVDHDRVTVHRGRAQLDDVPGYDPALTYDITFYY